MKRLYNITLALALCTTSAFAQKNSDLQFVTTNFFGDVTGIVTDGTTFEANTIDDSGFDPMISSGLAIKNNSESDVYVQLRYTIEKMDNGVFSCCFTQCEDRREEGSYTAPVLSSANNIVNLKRIKPSQTANLGAEWFFNGNGTCRVSFTVCSGAPDMTSTDPEGTVYNITSIGPSITVNFTTTPTGISTVSSASLPFNSVYSSKWYTVDGKKVNLPKHGVVIQKLPNGKTVKVVR